MAADPLAEPGAENCGHKRRANRVTILEFASDFLPRRLGPVAAVKAAGSAGGRAPQKRSRNINSSTGEAGGFHLTPPMNLLDRFRRSTHHHGSSRAPAAHMTWAARSVSHTLTSTRLFLKKQLWLWPIIAVVLLSTLGFVVHRAIESTMKANLRSELQTLLGVERAMVERWMATQERNAEAMANDAETRRAVDELLIAIKATGDTDDPAAVAKLREQLANSLGPAMTSHHYIGFVLVDRNHKVQAASEPEIIGMEAPAGMQTFVDKALDGVGSVSAPYPSISVSARGRRHAPHRRADDDRQRSGPRRELPSDRLAWLAHSP